MSELTPKREVESERIPGDGRPMIQIGQWYWAIGEKGKMDWFVCVVEIGSNYIRVESPDGGYERIHENDFEKQAKLEADPEAVIRGRTDFYKETVRAKLGQIKELTAKLGIQPRDSSAAPKSESRELSTFNAMPDLKKYKKELIQAKEKTLPKLFEEVAKAHERLTVWMSAKVLPMKAMCSGLEEAIEKINDRVFNVSLYAGLTEEVEQISKGKPADTAEKLKLFQRMCFMDEECLVNYRHGGMEFNDIEDFDKWISELENRDRILPWPRCMVAFRVRRNTKNRHYDGTLSCAMINFNLEQADKTTFMYIRNGDQLYRMTCDFEFDDHVFPSPSQVDFTEPMMAKERCDSVEDLITKRHWEDLCRKWNEKKRLHDAWEKENEGHHPSKSNPHWISSFDDPTRDYQPFNKSSVYYDDMEKKVETQLKYYNRIALIVQGLFDRSEVLHPHKPARLWSPGGMEEVVELVYDGAGSIHYQDPPDFEEYRKKVNLTMGNGSMTIGQQEAFEIREAKKYNERYGWRSSNYHPERYTPSGNDGPGFVAEIVEWTKTRKATFRWTRERQTSDYYSGKRYGDPIPTSMQVDGDLLFNVNGYTPGDFKQFYQDPRSRAKYLQWAPLLLSAEEWHAGNINKETGKFTFKKRPKKG